MPSLNTLSVEDRARALIAMKAAAASKVEMLAAPGETGNDPQPPRPVRTSGRAPKGWEPRVTFSKDGKPDAIFSPALPDDLSEHEALAEALRILNAMVPPGYWARLDEMRLDESGWQRSYNEELGRGVGDAFTGPVRRYKWKIEPEPTPEETIAAMSESEWAAAVDAVAKRRYPKLKTITDAGAVDLVVPFGDLQAGQHDGDSVEGMLARAALYPLFIKAEIKRLAMQKVRVRRVVMPALGDLVEGCMAAAFYSNQSWLVNLNRRDQVKIVRRLVTRIMEEVATLGYPVLVPVVPGNHGEHRGAKGKLVTDPADNDDIAIMEMVAELCQANPSLRDQFTFRFTEGNDLSVTLDLGWGWTVAFAHGHTAGGGAGAANKQQNWLAKQALANTAAGGAKFYVTGHFHSAMYVTLPGGRTWIQIPALCDSSEYFTDWYGLSGAPGLLTWTFGEYGLDNWRHHELPRLLDLVDVPGE